MVYNIPIFTPQDDNLFNRWYAETDSDRKNIEREILDERGNIPLFNDEIYKFLVLCSLKNKINEWNKWITNNRENFKRINLSCAYLCDLNLESVDLQKVYLKWAHFERSNLNYGHFEGAILRQAVFDGAYMWHVHLENAELNRSHLNRTGLRKVYIQGTSFRLASVDGDTLIDMPKIDKKTDFTGVGLSSMRVEPSLKVSLEKNIRKIHWDEWYKEHNKIQSLFVKLFWFISDNGCSTKRVIGTFFGMNLIFTVIYLVLTNCFGIPTIIQSLTSPFDVLTAYAQSTTLMFGITSGNFDYWALPWGVVLITFIHIMLGYLILAALITRFTIMFQNLSS